MTKLIQMSYTGINFQICLYHINVCFKISFACKYFCETISISCRYGSNFLLLLPISWLEMYLFVAFRNKLVNTNCVSTHTFWTTLYVTQWYVFVRINILLQYIKCYLFSATNNCTWNALFLFIPKHIMLPYNS